MITLLLSSILLLGQVVATEPVQTENITNVNGQNGQKTESVYTLIKLPYATDALAPVISKRTIELHHGKHLQGYVNNVNKLKKGTQFEYETDIVKIVKGSKASLFDNSGQLLNHNLYFMQFSPQGGGAPIGNIGKAIEKKWGSFEKFQQAFEKEGTSLFGSGWVWLASDTKGNLSIVKEPNGSNPVVRGLHPLLGIDVWEHAYYLDYENKRADHLKAVWKIIDWNVIEKRFNK